MQSLISHKICAQRDAQNTFLHLVPGFVNYTENNCVYANRQQRIVDASKCHLYFLPYKGLTFGYQLQFDIVDTL
jgi:hypothetical protein